MHIKPIVLSFITILTVFHISLAQQSATPSAQPSSATPSKANADTSVNESSDTSISDKYLDGVDKTLDAPLAATLAGLALAAAAFLLPLEQKKRGERGALSTLQLNERDRQRAESALLIEIEKVDKATKSMVWAFYLFVIALADAIFVHPFGALKGQMNVEYLVDLPLAGSGIVLGIGFMVRGGYLIKKVMSPGELDRNNEPSDASQSEKKA